jgi:integral membrane protein
MTTPETPDTRPVTPIEKIRTALLRYRVLAWVTGVWLLVLCGELVSHYAFHHPVLWITQVHGLFYFIYVLVAFDLAIKVRWQPMKTLGVLLAGTIPLVGIIVEHFQTRDIKARFNL